MKKLLIAFLFLAACAPQGPSNQLPNDWYVEPGQEDADDSTLTEPTPELEESVDGLFNTTAGGLELVQEPATAPLTSFLSLDRKPKDWVPWHLAAMQAEFGVSVKGLIGALIMKGTPSVVASWRKQYPKAKPVEPAAEAGGADAVVFSTSTPHDLVSQLEPAIRAAVATKKVKNESALRKNLLGAATDFLTVANALQTAEGNQWWVSRFRLDLTFDISGAVTPVVSAGAETRLRLEWHRIMPKAGAAFVPVQLALSSRERQIQSFAQGMLNSLEGASNEFRAVSDHGFRAHSFRVGIGFTAEGAIGIAKMAASVAGHIYFSADVKKPSVNPKPPESVALLKNGRASGFDGAKFLKGLKKAAKMGGFFAKRASKSKQGKWRVFEIKTGYDMNLSGKVGLVTVGGSGLTEISFYNMGF